MKKKLGLLFLLMLALIVASYAQTADNNNYAVSEIAVSSFQKLVVNANIDVILVQNDTLKKAFVEGDAKLVPEIAVTVVNGVMTIASRRQTSYRGKVQVNVAVQELTKLEVNADAGVVSFAPLHSSKLYVNINGYCDLHLKSNGKIYLDTESGYRLNYVKSTKQSDTVVLE